MSIHDELDRVADRAPVVEVPHDTWVRARRARTRDRALMLVGAAVVVLLAATLFWLPSRSEPPVADTDSLGVPDHLYVPEGLTASSDLDVGVAAAAWQEYSQVIVVGADGDYHLLEPPGYEDLLMTGHTVALAPDGTQLAYTWVDRAAQRTEIHVADLTTGEVRAVRTTDGPTVVEQLTWSSDGQWLAWLGSPVTWQADGSFSGRGSVAGTIADGTPASEDVGSVPDDANLALAVTPRGTVYFASTNTLVKAQPGARHRVETASGRLSPNGVVDPATGELVVGVGGNGPTERPPAGTVAVRIDPGTGDHVSILSTDPRLMSSPLGVLGADVLIAVSPMDGSGDHGDRRIELVGPGHEPQRVIEMDDLVPYDLTVATDLMTPDRLTVHRPEPAWPSTWWNTGLILELAVGAAALIAFVLVLARRRSR